MLIRFSVENYLSMKDTTVLEMLPTAIKEHEEDNIALLTGGFRLLKSAVIYGANSSGKSNILKAMIFMKKFILSSSKETQANEAIRVESFRLSTKTENKPSRFEIVFLNDGIKYRYGFTADNHSVQEEWLYYTKVNKEYPYFSRNGSNFTIDPKFSEGEESLVKKTRPNALFLSVLAQFNGPVSTSILQWVLNFKYINDENNKFLQDYTAKLFEDKYLKEILTRYMQYADLGFSVVTTQKQEYIHDWGGLPKQMIELLKGERANTTVLTQHIKYDENGKETALIDFNLNKNESLGTQKYFAMAGLVVETLAHGRVLIIDELDARLHPILSMSVARLFNSKRSNPRNAQLIFVTHDTNMLNKKIFRRDQILLTKKDRRFGSTTITTLAAEKARSDEAYEKNYLQGVYDGIPDVPEAFDLFGPGMI